MTLPQFIKHILAGSNQKYIMQQPSGLKKKGHFSENVQGTLRNCRREPQIFTRIIKEARPSLNRCEKGLLQSGALSPEGQPISILTAHRPMAWHGIPLHPAWPRVNGQLKSRTKECLTPDERQAKRRVQRTYNQLHVVLRTTGMKASIFSSGFSGSLAGSDHLGVRGGKSYLRGE